MNDKITRIPSNTLICENDIGKINCYTRFCDYIGLEVIKGKVLNYNIF